MRALRPLGRILSLSIALTAATVGMTHWPHLNAPQPVPTLAGPPSPRTTAVVDPCLEQRSAVLAEPGLLGAPELERVRAELVARAKAEPVIFVAPPTPTNLPPGVASWRERLHRTGVPWQVLNQVFSRFLRYPAKLRQILLTDGYLYAERPDLASLLASGLALGQLFDDPEVHVTRGKHKWRAIRRRNDYVWADGPEAGRPARIWLFDRMSVPDAALGPPLHVAIGGLLSVLGATRIEVEHITARAVAVSLVYGEYKIPAVLAIDSGEAVLTCESIPERYRAEVEMARALAMRRGRVLARLRAAITEQVGEALPFDEPKTEEGQQDGKLRQEWRTAYLQGRSLFEFNGDRYLVFRPDGAPQVPQVCVDFITDTWERMADTRWARRGEARQRRVGRLDFDALTIENRRSVGNFIAFAAENPAWFDVKTVPEQQRVAFANRKAFFRRLLEERADYGPGDVVAILGPRDDGKLHYHSFFIVDADPITAMPMLVAANAGQPRVRTWEGEMQNAPRRSIVARIRPRLEWLEAIAGVLPTAEGAIERALPGSGS